METVVVKIPPKSGSSRSSNVYTVNLPLKFKNGVLEKSRKFGGASQLITMSLGDLAARMRGMKNRVDVIQELNDYIKLEILLMRSYEEETESKKDTKLSFRIKDQLSEECLTAIKKKTGWSTSKAVRISLLWYLYANFDEFVASDSSIPLLRCPHCGFRTHDQRTLGVHIQNIHETVCPYCGQRHPVTENHMCSEKEAALAGIGGDGITPSQTTIDQFTTVPISDLDESSLLQELGLDDLGTLRPSDEEVTEDELDAIRNEISRSGVLADLPEGKELKAIIEERLKERKTKRDKDERVDEIESEISEILESLREDGLLDD